MQRPIKPLIPALYLGLALCLNQYCAAADSKFEQSVELYKQKKYEAAAKGFVEAAAVDARNPSIYYYQANCQYALGHCQDAIKFYRYLDAHFTTTREADYARSILKRIDASYSKQQTASETSKNKSASLSNVTAPKESKDQLIDTLVKVIRSQGNRPNVSNQLIEEAKSALNAYPTELLAALVNKHCDICLTPSTIDQDPRLQNTKPTGYEEGTSFKNCPGFFDGKHLVICQYAVYGSDESDWRPTDDPIGTLRHELGHAFDYCLGDVSEAEEFKHAYYLDLAQIEDDQKPRLAYFMQSSRTGPAETFAELACYQFGGRNKHEDRCTLVHSSFRRSATVLEKLLSGKK